LPAGNFNGLQKTRSGFLFSCRVDSAHRPCCVVVGRAHPNFKQVAVELSKDSAAKLGIV